MTDFQNELLDRAMALEILCNHLRTIFRDSQMDDRVISTVDTIRKMCAEPFNIVPHGTSWFPFLDPEKHAAALTDYAKRFRDTVEQICSDSPDPVEGRPEFDGRNPFEECWVILTAMEGHINAIKKLTQNERQAK